MRPLTEDEIKLVLEKLSKFLGDNLLHLIENSSDPHVFRLHRDRVFFLSEKLLKAAGCVPRKNLLSVGQCIGKITKGRKFRLGITALHVIAKYAPHKVWLNPGGEQAFVYGNHIIKRHVGRLTADMPSGAGVCVLSLNGDLPLGFGTSAKATAEIHTASTEAVSFYHHADVGEYLREEADLV
ncbi:60S ribosome subunit biogenesis protein NIP7, putative [Eimeria tenella]|uniref:60S ribosome subunit biogenesis protein NIP7 homolog n=1 Tax=Eimeria tenella TaxID=5802 RepID=U6KLM6_EIMTE|nr:60S ribosome subunit biogenesis protein NIP7, putative [Eimeria tenella]CDJ38987.1 60S ribosome subunit biogenesis protein NIP7, putative [Eimeria tenella]|eukprot:XP_013229742.1 60S ribosome subunit biogenesis protein NIP7, putative [Eimeria tenella]